MSRDLLTDPLCRAEDLGLPAPDSPHAVSVALPLWDHVIGYEEEDPEILNRLRAGYPRFFPPLPVRHLFAAVENEHARRGEQVLLFPVAGAARRCLDFVKAREGSGRIEFFQKSSRELHAVFLPDEPSYRLARSYWRFTGEGISSRYAEEILTDAPYPDVQAGLGALDSIKKHLAKLYGGGATRKDFHLFPSGMSAIFSIHRLLRRSFGNRPSVQLDFPYVDALKVQNHWGGGAHFVARYDPGDDAELRKLLAEKQPLAVFCEVASNPLMRTVKLPELRRLLEEFRIPLIVDDTIASVANVDVLPYADAVTTSLTKYFNGTGDVLAGSLLLNPKSEFCEEFKAAWLEMIQNPQEVPAGLWYSDALALSENSKDFSQRIARINASAEKVFDYLAAHPKVERIWFPKCETSDAYRALRRDDPGTGFGGLISIRLKGHEPAARKFYDKLKLTKGTSLGCNFSLVCPFTLLAHYRELEWAESCGVPRDLVRISVGLEDPDHLIRCFEEALS